VIAPEPGRLANLPTLDHDHVDPAPGEVQGEGEADGARSDDQHVGLERAVHASSSKAGRTTRAIPRAFRRAQRRRGPIMRPGEPTLQYPKVGRQVDQSKAKIVRAWS